MKGMTTVIKDLLVQKLESKVNLNDTTYLYIFPYWIFFDIKNIQIFIQAEKSGLQIPALSEAGRTSRRGSIHIPDGNYFIII